MSRIRSLTHTLSYFIFDYLFFGYLLRSISTCTTCTTTSAALSVTTSTMTTMSTTISLSTDNLVISFFIKDGVSFIIIIQLGQNKADLLNTKLWGIFLMDKRIDKEKADIDLIHSTSMLITCTLVLKRV